MLTFASAVIFGAVASAAALAIMLGLRKMGIALSRTPNAPIACTRTNTTASTEFGREQFEKIANHVRKLQALQARVINAQCASGLFPPDNWLMKREWILHGAVDALNEMLEWYEQQGLPSAPQETQL